MTDRRTDEELQAIAKALGADSVRQVVNLDGVAHLDHTKEAGLHWQSWVRTACGMSFRPNSERTITSTCVACMKAGRPKEAESITEPLRFGQMRLNPK